MIYLSYALYFITGVLLVIIPAAVIIIGWVKVSLWIMGLGVDDDDNIDWPWKK